VIFKYTATDQQLEQAKQFANERLKLSESLYRIRGEAKVSKMAHDIVVGLLGEYAVQTYLNSLGLNCSEPDITIHTERQKSFGADLKFDGGYFHVKSQSVESASKYGASWLFQKEDRTLTLPSENGFMAFCLVNGREVEIKAIVSHLDISECKELLKTPKVYKYQFTKVAVYLDDVLKLISNLNAVKDLTNVKH
jgi:hypothetical protein